MWATEMGTSIRKIVRLAVLLFAFGALAPQAMAAGKSVDTATDEERAAASEMYRRANSAFAEGRLDDALQGFKDSYDIVASPNSHLMVAKTLLKIGRKVEAHETLNEVIAGAEAAAQLDPKYEAAAEAARDLQALIRPELGLLKIVGTAASASPGASLIVNGREIPPERWSDPVLVEAGSVIVTLAGQIRDVSVPPGGEATADFTPAAPPPEPEPPVESTEYEGPDRMLLAIIGGGVGAAGLISFAIFGGLALGKFNDLEDSCPDRVCVEDRQDDIDSGHTFQVVANVSLGVAFVGLVVGGTFLTWALIDDDEGQEQSAVRPRLRVGLGSFMMEGSF
jgi:hypothetical protein